MSLTLFHIPKKLHSWIEAPATDRERIAASGRAEFITALDVDMTGDDPSAWLYHGDFYLDFDSEDIAETIGKVKEFLLHVREKGLALDQVRLFASGKKGFHIEIPLACLMPLPKPLPLLPAIYKEMAQALYHDTMDMSVYTAKKGRMWRVPNFRRPDINTYKVQITLDEAMAMTATTYSAFVATPRPLFAVQPATLCPALAVMFSTARAKAAQRTRLTADTSKAAQGLKERVQRLRYPFPACLLGIVTGTQPAREGKGFNAIAMQLAPVARALDLSEDMFIDVCRGLIDRHQGDGDHYPTRMKREAQLRAQYRNPVNFSVGGLRSILPPGTPCPDLEGL